MIYNDPELRTRRSPMSETARAKQRARTAAYRARQKEKGEPDSSHRNSVNDRRASRDRAGESATWTQPFVGCDGEGAGVDDKGRQLYMLFRMGERELYTGKPLSTREILSFICDAPAKHIYVGFAFGYDTTMILKDFDESRARHLFQPFEPGQGHSRYTWFGDFDVEYLPKNYLKVKRVTIERDANGKEVRRPVKGSQRIIYETFGFFQKSFLKCLESFDVGTEAERKSIAENKARRADFVSIDQEERDYCAMECRFLAELMEKLRDYCQAAGIVPRTWSGAGKLASALHGLHHTMKSVQYQQLVPPQVEDWANMAYYGGRFEITRTGMLNQSVHEYDICSAYPDAMRKLPCLDHGEWHWTDDPEELASAELAMCSVSFEHKEIDGGFAQLCGLPIRTKAGHLNWPRMGNGIYWSVEIDAAKQLGAEIIYRGGWIYETHCDCKEFDWLEPLYDYRKSIGSQGAGYPIKLAINSLYGKLAQRKGNGVYHNMVWAGLITAHTRAKLMSAIALAPDQIVMVATDAVYSLVELSGLAIGDRLGQWEHNLLPDFFIVQPGLYWSPGKRTKKKSRGLPGKLFEQGELTQAFEKGFSFWQANDVNGQSFEWPKIPVPVPGFIGLKLALARNKRELAGTWVNETREISFDYSNKRSLHRHMEGHIVTAAIPGDAELHSLPHRDFLKAGGQEAWELAREGLEEQPDWVDLSTPFED